MKLSIITPTCNRVNTLEKNVESVLKQTFNDIEHIIVDNMSNDGTSELINDYKKKAKYPVIYIRENDKGIYNAINKGIKHASGEWIHILNSDDMYYSKHCLKDIFRNKDVNKYDLLVSPIFVGNDDNNEPMHKWIPEYNKDLDHYDFPHLGTIIKSDFYKSYGYYSEKYRIVSDAIYNIVNYKNAKFIIFDKPLVLMSDSGISSKDTMRNIYEKIIVLILYHNFPFKVKIRYLFNYCTKMMKILIQKVKDRFIIKLLNKLNLIIFKITENFKPYIRSRKYKGFDLFYSKGTSLITHLLTGGYENDLCSKLSEDITKTNSKNFLDIGSNIGLISLYVLSKIPDIKIFAYEPGPHQYSLFKKTIDSNQLESNITLYNKALSNKKGISKFAVHNAKDVSGDGFFDTGRAGEAQSIEVEVSTVDTWWKEEGKPEVKVVKIDTEGAELWILEGATSFLSKCKPNLYLEVWPDNLNPYPYDAYDILRWLQNNKYDLSAMNGERITQKNFQRYLGVEATFVARPI